MPMRKVSAFTVRCERSPSMNKYRKAMPKLTTITNNTRIIKVFVITNCIKLTEIIENINEYYSRSCA